MQMDQERTENSSSKSPCSEIEETAIGEFNKEKVVQVPPDTEEKMNITYQVTRPTPFIVSSGISLVPQYSSHLSVSLSATTSTISCSINCSEGGSSLTPSSSRSQGTTTGQTNSLVPHVQRNFHSRPSSPPPATHLPPRRFSLSLPASPLSMRSHRASLPVLPSLFQAYSPSGSRSNLGTNSSSDFMPRAAPSSPPPLSRSPGRRYNRTPSPRPPLPIPAPSHEAPLPQPHSRSSSGPLSKPLKARMRSR